MTEDVWGDTSQQSCNSKEKELAVLLKLWRDSKRDPLEFSQRLANLSFEDLTEETAP
jgi:hypothetical protein